MNELEGAVGNDSSARRRHWYHHRQGRATSEGPHARHGGCHAL